MTQIDTQAWPLVDPGAPYRIRHRGKRYGSVLEALAGSLSGTEKAAEREKLALELLRRRFTLTADAGERLSRFEASAIHGLFADHEFITGDELERCVLRVREELVAEQGLRIIDSVAAGLAVLINPDSAVELDPHHVARLADLGVEVPIHDGEDGLGGYIDAVHGAVGAKWGEVAQELFGLGIALILHPVFLEMRDPEVDFRAIAGELLEAVRDDAESLGVGDAIAAIVESDGYLPSVMVNHMTELARTAVAWRIERDGSGL